MESSSSSSSTSSSSSSKEVVKDDAKMVVDIDKILVGGSEQTWAEISRAANERRAKALNLEHEPLNWGEPEWLTIRNKRLEREEALRKKKSEKKSREDASSSEEEKKSGDDSSSEEEKTSLETKLEEKDKVKEIPSDDCKKEEEAEKSDELEKTDTESDIGVPFDYVPDDGGVVTEDEMDSDGEEEQSQEEQDRVYWRINFRNRNRVMSDNIYVDATSPPPEPGSPNSLSQFEKGPDGETLASYFQFRHILKESTYKNKYVIQLDGFKMTYSERDDSLLIQNGGDATVHMGTSSNTEFRDRNMAMEQLREILAMRIRVWKSLFISNRSAQMGEMDMTKCVNMITADHLTVMMDNYANVVQIVNLHRPVLKKFTLICCDEFPEIFDLEQIRLCPTIKLDGPSNMSDDQLLCLKAARFEIESDKITSEGINAFLKVRLSDELPERFHAYLSGTNWDTKVAMSNLNFTEYENKEEYEKKNGSVIINMEYATMGYIPTNRPDVRAVVVMTKTQFRCFREGQRTELIAHDLTPLE